MSLIDGASVLIPLVAHTRRVEVEGQVLDRSHDLDVLFDVVECRVGEYQVVASGDLFKSETLRDHSVVAVLKAAAVEVGLLTVPVDLACGVGGNYGVSIVFHT